MTPSSLLVAVFVVTVSILAQTPIAAAQVTEADLLRAIEVARGQGAQISEQEVANILTQFRQEVVRASQMKEELQWEAEALVQDLEHPISHVKGEEGKPFPAPDQVIFQPQPTPSASSQSTENPAPLWSPEPYERPTACERNETIRTEHTPGGDDSTIYVDRLFLSEELVPLDSGEVYGSKAVLIPYGPNESEGTMVRMSIYRVPCVPYRMRSTGAADYIDTGINALTNYTANPAGKGILHSFVQQKLYPEKFGGREPLKPRRR
jgi:hypothetical protein